MRRVLVPGGGLLLLDHVDVDLHVWKRPFHVDQSPLHLYSERRRRRYGDPGRSHVSVYLESESCHRTFGGKYHFAPIDNINHFRHAKPELTLLLG